MLFHPRPLRILVLAALVASTGSVLAEEQKQQAAEGQKKQAAAKQAPAQKKSDLVLAAEAAEARRKAIAAGLVDKDAPSSDTPSALAAAAAAARQSKAKREEGSEFTTADLERMFGGASGGVYQGGDAGGEATPSEAPTPSSPAGRAGDPLALMQMQQAQQQQQREEADAAQAEIERLESRIQELERRKIAITNIYLPRPDVKGEEGNEDWEQLDSRERVERTNAQLAELRKQLADARGKSGG